MLAKCPNGVAQLNRVSFQQSFKMAMNEIKDRVVQLENAIKRLDYVKRHLSRNASDIKAEIHANVSRNLECLRGREVSLLSQVDKVLAAKEETLQQQQARLNQALGVLQTGLSMVQDDSATEKQLMETLDKLNKIELSPVETPYIAFRADHIGLRETIVNYGRVDSNGLPLITAFEDPGNPSASLPRHVEEYEDVDHHVFYKTVEEVTRSKNLAPRINVAIPKLSTRVEDWLQKKLPSPQQQPRLQDESYGTKCMPAQRPCTLNKCGDVPTVTAANVTPTATPGSSCSLNNWLSFIKRHADLEEEHDFEIIDNSSPQKGATQYSNKMTKDLKEWLSPGSTFIKATPSTGDFFKHIPKDTKVWLVQACQQLVHLEDLKERDFFHHISQEPATWLRSRAHCKQQSQPKSGHDFFAHITKDMKCWLQKNTKAYLGDEKEMDTTNNAAIDDKEKWLLRSSASAKSLRLEDICRANEQCSSITECVSQPDCVTMCLASKSCQKNPTFSKDVSEVFKPLVLPKQAWLAPGVSAQAKQEEDEQGTPGDVFGHIPDLKSGSWLTKSTDLSTSFKDNKEETNIWLQKSKSEAKTVEDINLTLPSTEFNLADWLLVPQKEKMVTENEKDESEGWSICSDSQSTSTEQHANDVTAAQEYFRNWLY